MKIIREKISKDELKKIAEEDFGFYAKVVVDVENEILAFGGETHSDEKALLLDEGSKQKDLWRINIYVDKPKDERVEFDSVINIRPSSGNMTRDVKDPAIKNKIVEIVSNLIG